MNGLAWVVILFLLVSSTVDHFRIKGLENRINQQYQLLCKLDKPIESINNEVYKCIGS